MVRKLKRSTFKKYKKSKLIYGCNYRFYKYLDIRKINISFKSKYSFLVNIFNDLDKLSMVKTQKERTKEKKQKVNDTAFKPIKYLLEIYFDKTLDLLDKKNKMDPKCNPSNLIFGALDYSEWYKDKSNDSVVKGYKEKIDKLSSMLH